ncbi:AlbA family DNA-binding domain-containing protein [Methanosarcina sp. Mfa9]|uniref:AlbA family DNA-binding domain-containing protein n=1 Tax=Methanosarcina sp. Mfa9 TaxID=3439063 RepID=UPI003F83FA47
MVEKEIDSLCNQYGLRATNLSELTLDINFPDPLLESRFRELENTLYLPLSDGVNAVSSLSFLAEAEPSAYIQLVLDPEKASAEYLEDFLNNPLGRKIRKAWEARGFIRRPDSLSEEKLLEDAVSDETCAEGASFSSASSVAEVYGEVYSDVFEGEGDSSGAVAVSGAGDSLAALPPVDINSLSHSRLYLPDLQTQKEVLKVKGLIKELMDQLRVFECRLSTYPKDLAHIEEKIVHIREAVQLANDSDYVLELIRRGESKKLEFKSTLRMNLMSGKPDWNIEHAVLKTIVAYLNTDGGVLLVGVSNDGEVLGIENEGFPNEDKFLLHFKQLIKQHIGLDYAPLIEYSLVPVGGKKILEVDCRKSDEAVFMTPNKKDEEFYIRIGPSSERLTGSKLIEYVSRWYNGNGQQ